MRIDILTLFPEMFTPLMHSITGRAVKQNKLEIAVHDIRAYSKNKHKKTDDYPFGGGAGMVMTCQPVFDAVSDIDPGHEAHRIYLSPRGQKLDQPLVKQLSKHQRLLLLCGHYEGVDERVIELCMDGEISIGDYVLTGGEIPAMVLADSVSRYVDGVLSGEDSLEEESFSDGLLEYPQYTRPEDFLGHKVPPVLLSGNHAEIKRWRRQRQMEVTSKRRPDLMERHIAESREKKQDK